jgi:hypothetical protein
MRVYFKQDLAISDSLSDWQMITTENQSIWVRMTYNKYLFNSPIPHHRLYPYALLDYLKEALHCKYFVPSVNLFENYNRLSTQVPMHQIYYTECKELLEWDKHLGNNITIRYFEHAWELERLQKLVLQEIK